VDMKCAENAGLKKILVLTGHGNEYLDKCKNEIKNLDFIAQDIMEASRYITSQNNRTI